MNWNGSMSLSPVVGQPPANAGFAAPMIPGVAPMGLPSTVTPPAVTAASVYIAPRQCDVSQIPLQAGPACPDPRLSVQLNRRVFTTVVSGLFVADDGDSLVGGFTLTTPGLVAGQPEASSFVLRTDATTRGVVRDLVITFDAFSLNYLAFGVTIPEVLNSYAQSYTSLLAGRVTIDNVPFATLIPIGSAIRKLSGIRAYWTGNGTGTAGQTVLYVSGDNESTSLPPGAPIEIPLPASSEFGVFLNILSRDVVGGAGGYTAIIGGTDVAASFVWTGLITVTIELHTSLGAFGLPMAS